MHQPSDPRPGRRRPATAAALLTVLLSSAVVRPPVAASAGRGQAQDHAGARANRLAGESSPYLLLHRFNPVDWYPWGEEALQRAKAENKPIFLSVGYSTCYWCHVMERESFSDPAIAALMNERFVNIKVDREERPELDEIYMTATQLLTRQGGWPNSVFLTPDLQPFFAGTYFPPRDRAGRPGFTTVLDRMAEAWADRRPKVESSAARIAEAMEAVLEARAEPSAAPAAAALADTAVDQLRSRFDATWGGFSKAPKFPTPASLLLLLEVAARRPEVEDMVATTLDRMARGGIYDQLAGGFHRYATDRRWRVPHFEKMLYDNALLLAVYARWHQRSGDPEAARVVRETAAFLAREMTSPEGALLSAIDAETDAEEGAFYVWTRAQLDAVLGADAAFLAPLLGFDGKPFFEGDRYVLHLPETLTAAATERGTDRRTLLAKMAPLRERLLAHRATRERPLTDDKVLTDWNGLGIAGLATAGRLLGDAAMTAAAVRAADFVLHRLRPAEGPLQHAWRGGTARIDAYLDDYAFLIHGLLALHETTGEARWLSTAAALSDEQSRRLEDPRGGFFVAPARSDLLFRSKPVHDGALPAGNGVAILNLLTLAERTGQPRFRDQAARALRAFAPQQKRAPAAYHTLALAVDRYHRGTVAGDPQAAAGADEATVRPGTLDAEAETLVTAAARWRGAAATGGWRPLAVTLRIAEGWHVNANPASDDFLIATRVEAAAGALRAVAYPPGHPLKLAFAEQELSVYDGEATITAEARPDAGGALRLTLIYQACDDRRCLPPVERVLAVE